MEKISPIHSKKNQKKPIPAGSIRLLAEGLVPVRKTGSGWIKDKAFDACNILKIVALFKSHGKLDALLDTKDDTFLKGFLRPDGHVAGERIIILPDGKKLDKAYSLFSPHLTIHDTVANHEPNHHWDVIYQNPNGEFAYVYTLDKKLKSQKNKYRQVEEFEKVLPKLNRNVLHALKNNDFMAFPLYTLLRTYMRVGNEEYFRLNGHEGLTTLRKKDITVRGDVVIFKFNGKDGVPQNIEARFPPAYISFISKRIKSLKSDGFIFGDDGNRALKDTQFEDAFLKYCGKRFYPHIVRSYYATSTIEKFLEKNHHPTKNDVKKIYNEVAGKLGHKKFSKKTEEWLPSHTVTVAHYISPKLVKKINSIIQK